MIKKSKLLLFLLALILFFPSTTSFASTEDTISIKEAKNIAYNFIISNMFTQKKSEEKGWKDKLIFGESDTLYDLDDSISAYLFNLLDTEGAPSGYIIIGASTDYAPIIEYSHDHEPFLYKAANEVLSSIQINSNINSKKNKFYYTGDLNYFYEIEDSSFSKSLYDISGNYIHKTTKEKASSIQESKGTPNSYKEAWNSIKSVSGSTPPTTGQIYITNPSSYETSYNSSASGNVSGYSLTYKTTSNFTGYSDHCAPTAGVNLALYWYNRGYTALYDNNSWKTTFSTLYKNMKTAENSGTFPSDFSYAMWQYMYRECNVLTAYSTDSNVSSSDIKNSITNGRPFGLAVYEHQLYGNHMVLGLGWQEFVYSSGYTSLYIRIADGWSSSPTRFIHRTEGLDSMTMCIVYPQ